MPNPTLTVILRRVNRAVETAKGDLRRTDDPDFLAGLCHVGTLRYDARAGGGVRDGAPDWQPVVGFDEIACRVGRRSPGLSEGGGRPGEALTARVLFAHELPAHRGYQLAVEDSLTGERTYYFTGPVIEEAYEDGTPHHWVGVVQDRPT
jgi:hypothetical protein